jgi:hypothetical protein
VNDSQIFQETRSDVHDSQLLDASAKVNASWLSDARINEVQRSGAIDEVNKLQPSGATEGVNDSQLPVTNEGLKDS